MGTLVPRVPVITKKYVTEVDNDTLTEALDLVEENQLPDLVSVSKSSSSDDDTSEKEKSSEYRE